MRSGDQTTPEDSPSMMQFIKAPENDFDGRDVSFGFWRYARETGESRFFASKSDALKRLLLEQCVTFPRFLFSGAWWRAWRQRRRH